MVWVFFSDQRRQGESPFNFSLRAMRVDELGRQSCKNKRYGEAWLDGVPSFAMLAAKDFMDLQRLIRSLSWFIRIFLIIICDLLPFSHSYYFSSFLSCLHCFGRMQILLILLPSPNTASHVQFFMEVVEDKKLVIILMFVLKQIF